MNIRITPDSVEHWLELRAKDITSTEISSLFGCSPYATEFEVWYRKKHEQIITIEQNDRMRWGTRLEEAIALGIAEDNVWEVRHIPEYMRDPELRIGSSFDFAILKVTKEMKEPDREIKPGAILYAGPYETTDYVEEGLLEIKNVDSLAFQDGWIVEGDNLEAPPHIELQVQHQLLVSGLKYAKVGALVGGNRVYLIHREPDPLVQDLIKKKAAAFWKSIVENRPPNPDFNRDSKFISELYSFAQPGKYMDATTNPKIFDLARTYKVACDDEKLAKEKKESAKAQLLMMIGDHEKVQGEGFSISAGVVGPAQINYIREPYRGFRINWKKEKK